MDGAPLLAAAQLQHRPTHTAKWQVDGTYEGKHKRLETLNSSEDCPPKVFRCMAVLPACQAVMTASNGAWLSCLLCSLAVSYENYSLQLPLALHTVSSETGNSSFGALLGWPAPHTHAAAALTVASGVPKRQGVGRLGLPCHSRHSAEWLRC